MIVPVPGNLYITFIDYFNRYLVLVLAHIDSKLFICFPMD